jgi:hypothetical protein
MLVRLCDSIRGASGGGGLLCFSDSRVLGYIRS